MRALDGVLPQDSTTPLGWPPTLPDGDVVIVREGNGKGRCYVLHSCRGPQVRCRSYIEAELQATVYAERARANSWYRTECGLQLVSRTGVRSASGGASAPP